MGGELNYGLVSTDAEVVVTLDADTLFERTPCHCWCGILLTDSGGRGWRSQRRKYGQSDHSAAGPRVRHQSKSRSQGPRTGQRDHGRARVIGAWRREALLSIGGFHADTLAEDADATIRLERAGWQVLYEPFAIARTEAPEKIRAFLKQRLRWMFGTLQVAYKNRNAMWRARPIGVGLFGLPNIVIFQFLFTLIAPVIDFLLLWSLVAGTGSTPCGLTEGIPPTIWTVGAYWLFFRRWKLVQRLWQCPLIANAASGACCRCCFYSVSAIASCCIYARCASPSPRSKVACSAGRSSPERGVWLCSGVPDGLAGLRRHG